MPFERNVFVNCPFDEAFYPLLRPLLFTILYLGFRPRMPWKQQTLDKLVSIRYST
jgi:hypothetical protein